MRAGGTSLGAVCGLLVFHAFLHPVPRTAWPTFRRASIAKQRVHKAKLIEKLGDAQLEKRAMPEKPRL